MSWFLPVGVATPRAAAIVHLGDSFVAPSKASEQPVVETNTLFETVPSKLSQFESTLSNSESVRPGFRAALLSSQSVVGSLATPSPRSAQSASVDATVDVASGR
jgi:hypothetical protein